MITITSTSTIKESRTMAGKVQGQRFLLTHRLRGDQRFKAVLAARVVCCEGPLRVHGCPNDLEHSRLGLRVGRRVGPAVTRSRIRRLLREAFRRSWSAWPGSYDLVVSVTAAEPMGLGEYRRLLDEAVQAIHRRWQRRRRPSGEGPPKKT